MKDVSEYLHLYIGQQCKGDSGSMIYTIFGINDGKPIVRDKWGNDCFLPDFKLIVRRLPSMTEEEAWEYVGGKSTLYDDISISIKNNGVTVLYTIVDDENCRFPQEHRVDFSAFTPKQFIWLISKGFWLFGSEYFDKGLILDKNKL